MNGSCLCGNIRFEVTGPLTKISACHCQQCRRQSGHVWSSGQVAVADLTIEGDVTWFASSDTAKRGFCGTCGSFLFWKAHHEDAISVAMGAFDGSTGKHLEKHIFVADKGDYYDITDDVPQS